jgi:hypothetical protein
MSEAIGLYTSHDEAENRRLRSPFDFPFDKLRVRSGRTENPFVLSPEHSRRVEA